MTSKRAVFLFPPGTVCLSFCHTRTDSRYCSVRKYIVLRSVGTSTTDKRDKKRNSILSDISRTDSVYS